jgi:soluble lytic murein transglycosylase-like protein
MVARGHYTSEAIAHPRKGTGERRVRIGGQRLGLSLAAFALALALGVPAAEANIYSFKDENGVTHFSNLPHLDKRFKLVYRIPESWKTRPNAWTPSFPKSVDIGKLVPIIDNAARTHGVDPRLVHAVIRAESGYNERALSNKGAMGLMQLIPATAERMGVKNVYDPVENIFGGTKYLAFLLKMFNGDTELALAGYNAGENAVVRAGRKIPPFAETQAYVPKVLSFYKSPELNRFVSQPVAVAPAAPAPTAGTAARAAPLR